MYSSGGAASGTVVLSWRDRRDLAEGQLVLRMYVKGIVGSAADLPLRFDRAQ
jgi:hypothetical protein